MHKHNKMEHLYYKNNTPVRRKSEIKTVHLIFTLLLTSSITISFLVYRDFKIKEEIKGKYKDFKLKNQTERDLDVHDPCIPYVPKKKMRQNVNRVYSCPIVGPDLVKQNSQMIYLSIDPYLNRNTFDCYYLNNYKWYILRDLTPTYSKFAEVKCYNFGKIIYFDYLPILPDIVSKEENHNPNIIIMILRSVSRIAFHNRMKNTYKTLRSLKAFEYKYFNSMGVRFMDNIIPLLKGCTYKEQNCINSSFIWNDFSDLSYFTSYFEDGISLSSSLPHYIGTDNSFFDYDWTINNKIEEKLGHNWIYESYPFCLRNNKYVTLLQEQILKILFQCKIRKKPAFVLFVSNAARENEEVLTSIDDEYSDFLMKLHEQSILKNSFLFFASDSGSYDFTKNKFIERLLPFLFVVVPESFKDRHEIAFTNMFNNQQSIISHINLYNSIRRLRDLSLMEDYKKGKTIFSKLNKYRSCHDAKIPEEYCACKRKSVNIENAFVKYAANSIIFYLNEKLTCSDILLRQIWDVRYIPSAHLYIIKLFVSPGDYFLEGVVVQESNLFYVKNVVKLKSSYSKNSNNTCLDQIDNL